MSFTSIFIPTGAAGPTAISTSGTTQELDPADSPIINLTSTTAADVATLPAPQKKSAKVQESGSFVIPKVIIGQYLTIFPPTFDKNIKKQRQGPETFKEPKKKIAMDD